MICRSKPALLARPDRGERLGRDAEHIAGALLEAADLAGRVANGPAHLPADLGGDLLCLGDEGVDRLAEHRAALLDRPRAPRDLGGAGGVERAVDARGGVERPLHVDPAVDGAHGLECLTGAHAAAVSAGIPASHRQ